MATSRGALVLSSLGDPLAESWTFVDDDDRVVRPDPSVIGRIVVPALRGDPTNPSVVSASMFVDVPCPRRARRRGSSRGAADGAGSDDGDDDAAAGARSIATLQINALEFADVTGQVPFIAVALRVVNSSRGGEPHPGSRQPAQERRPSQSQSPARESPWCNHTSAECWTDAATLALWWSSVLSVECNAGVAGAIAAVAAAEHDERRFTTERVMREAGAVQADPAAAAAPAGGTALMAMVLRAVDAVAPSRRCGVTIGHSIFLTALRSSMAAGGGGADDDAAITAEADAILDDLQDQVQRRRGRRQSGSAAGGGGGAGASDDDDGDANDDRRRVVRGVAISAATRRSDVARDGASPFVSRRRRRASAAANAASAAVGAPSPAAPVTHVASTVSWLGAVPGFVRLRPDMAPHAERASQRLLAAVASESLEEEPTAAVARSLGPLRATLRQLAIGDSDSMQFHRFCSADGGFCAAFVVDVEVAA
jgi:hypothetical protein